MDMLENKKIRDKINGLEELPETYHPNMASKWSLLEAGLDGKDKDNRKIIAWKRIAVAAVLILMAGSTFVLLNYQGTSQLSEKSPVVKNALTLREAKVPGITEIQPIQKKKEDPQLLKKVNRKKSLYTPVKEEDKIAVTPVKDSIVQPLAPLQDTLWGQNKPVCINVYDLSTVTYGQNNLLSDTEITYKLIHYANSIDWNYKY